jgi:hypothetical protein
MTKFVRNLIKTLLISAQMAFVSPRVPHSLPASSSTSLARGQSAPRPEDIRFLAQRSKAYVQLKNITDTTINQIEKVQRKANSKHLSALHKTYNALLQYKKNGLKVDSLLRIVEEVLSPHRRFNNVQ